MDDKGKAPMHPLPPAPPHNSKVFIDGIPPDTTDQDLRTLCSRCGDIYEVRLGKDDHTGQNQDYAVVAFVNEEDAKIAVETLNGWEVKGRKLRFSQLWGYDYGGDSMSNRGGGGGGGYGQGSRDYYNQVDAGPVMGQGSRFLPLVKLRRLWSADWHGPKPVGMTAVPLELLDGSVRLSFVSFFSPDMVQLWRGGRGLWCGPGSDAMAPLMLPDGTVWIACFGEGLQESHRLYNTGF